MSNIRKDFERLVGVMQMCGIASADLCSPSRKYPLSYYRGMIAEQLREQGYTLTEIAALLNRKSHATILHEIHSLRSLHLPGYNDVNAEYEEFRRCCKEDPIDLTRREVGEILLTLPYPQTQEEFNKNIDRVILSVSRVLRYIQPIRVDISSKNQ